MLVTQAFVVTDKFKKKSQRPQDSPKRNDEEYLPKQPRRNDRDRNTFSAPSISPRVSVSSERVTLFDKSELYLRFFTKLFNTPFDLI